MYIFNFYKLVNLEIIKLQVFSKRFYLIINFIFLLALKIKNNMIISLTLEIKFIGNFTQKEKIRKIAISKDLSSNLLFLYENIQN